MAHTIHKKITENEIAIISSAKSIKNNMEFISQSWVQYEKTGKTERWSGVIFFIDKYVYITCGQ